VVSPTRLGEMLASAEKMADPDGELTDGETFRMGNVQEYFLNFLSNFFVFFFAWNIPDYPRLIRKY